MNPFNYFIIDRIVRKNANDHAAHSGKPSRKVDSQRRSKIRHYIREGIYVSLGILAAAFGLEAFLLPKALLDGGATGISLLISAVSGTSLGFLLIVVNLPFIALGYYQIGRGFAIRSTVAILILAIFVAFVHFPMITQDVLLVAVFGGFFIGLGIGLVIRGGAVIDGTEILAIYLAKQIGFSIGEIVFVFNVIIFALAGYLISMETALYSLLTYFVASKTVDYVLEGFEEYIGITIVSDKSSLIRSMILRKLNRGVTVYEGHKGYRLELKEEKSNVHILFTVITRLEMVKIQTEIDLIDPRAFVVMHKIKDTKGGMIQHRLLKQNH